jgi:hypothetical protein
LDFAGFLEGFLPDERSHLAELARHLDIDLDCMSWGVRLAMTGR